MFDHRICSLVFFTECRSSRIDWFASRWEYLRMELERAKKTRLEQMHLFSKKKREFQFSHFIEMYVQIRRTAFAEDGSYFVTVGNRHVKFWYLISTASVSELCSMEKKIFFSFDN